MNVILIIIIPITRACPTKFKFTKSSYLTYLKHNIVYVVKTCNSNKFTFSNIFLLVTDQFYTRKLLHFSVKTLSSGFSEAYLYDTNGRVCSTHGQPALGTKCVELQIPLNFMDLNKLKFRKS